MITLDIKIVESYNPRTIAVADTSLYAGQQPVNPNIEITAPGFSKVSLPFTPGAVNVYNGNNLGITNVKAPDQLSTVPDGFYLVKYSIFPNSKTFVTLGHMRVHALKGILYEQFISFLSGARQNPGVKKRLEDISFLLDGATMALDPQTAGSLYTKAKAMLAENPCNKC